MSKEELVNERCFVFGDDVETTIDVVYEIMDEYAREEAIAFFKWYGVKMMGFIEYIKDIRPVVTSNEIEEKIAEFEGQTFDNLYNLFIQQTENSHE